MVKTLYVKDIGSEKPVEMQLAVYSIRVKKTRNGDHFIQFVLGDRTGTINANHWTSKTKKTHQILDGLTEGDVVEVKGSVGRFNNEYNLTVSPNKGEYVRRIDTAEYDESDFKYAVDRDRDKLFAELKEYMDQVTDTFLKTLVESFLCDPELKQSFINCPAAQRKHHNYLGGLMEHTLGVLKLCDCMQAYYKGIDRDLVIVGAILHDLGKIYTYEYERMAISWTEEGTHLNHIISCDQLISEHIKEINNFPKDLELKLRNMLLSHHGEVSNGWGSAVNPQTPEAVLLHYADLLDSRVKGRLDE